MAAAEALAHSRTVTVLLLGGRMRGRTLATVDHWAVDMLAGLVIGSIYGGIATPTEAGAVGAAGAGAG